MRRFYTADLRLGDATIIASARRPFIDVDEMDDALIHSVNDSVDRGDELWILGDLSTGDLGRAIDRASALNGRKRLLLGELDPASALAARAGRDQAIAAFADAGIEVIDAHWLRETIDGADVLVSHLPYMGYTEDVPIDNAPVYSGLPLIHGHGYGSARLRPKQFNVGVDVNWFAPVPEEQIRAWVHGGAGIRA